MRTPATWPLRAARAAPPSKTPPAALTPKATPDAPAPETILSLPEPEALGAPPPEPTSSSPSPDAASDAPPEANAASPPPEVKPDIPPADAPLPFGPAHSHSAGERLLRRGPAAAQSSPKRLTPFFNPPSLEAVLEATSVDESTDRKGWRRPRVLIAALASLAVLVPCLIGAAFMILSPDLSPLALLSLQGIDEPASLPAYPAAPPAAPGIAAAAGMSVTSGEPQVSAQEPHQAEHSPEPPAPPPPAAAVFAASPAPAPAISPASEADADNRITADEPVKDAPAAEMGRLKHQKAASREPVAPAPANAPAVAASPAPIVATSPSQLQREICRQDGERLARLQARPSLDEAISFVSELRCTQLWPRLQAFIDGQLQAVTDGLSKPARSIASSSLKGEVSDTRSAIAAAPATEASSVALDNDCKHDEERLAELRANPSVEAANRFDGELKCPSLQPQLPSLAQLSHATGSAEAANPKGAPPKTSSVEAASPISDSSASDDAPSHDPGIPPPPVVAASPPAAHTTSPASEADAHNGVVAFEDLPAPQVGRLAPHEDAHSPEPVAPPPPAAPAVSMAAPAPVASPGSEAVAEAEKRIAARESDKEALSAEVSRLKRDREAPEQTNSIPAPSVAAPVKQPQSGPSSQAAADAERRIAALESEKDALAAEVSRLERDREPAEKANTGPAAATAISAVGSGPEPSALASLPEDMPARVLIRYPRGNADARRQAESLADTMKKQGVEVADLRESDGAVRTGVSFFYAPDAAVARRIGGLLGVAPTRRPQVRDGLMARPGAIELSFSGDSHLAVVATPRKESVQ